MLIKTLNRVLPAALLIGCSLSIGDTTNTFHTQKLIQITKETKLAYPFSEAISKNSYDDDFSELEDVTISRIERRLKKGANLDGRDQSTDCNIDGSCTDVGHKKTALIYAAYEGFPRVVKFLVENKADVNLKDDADWNAYMLAEYYRDRYKKSLLAAELKPVSDIHSPKDKENTVIRYRDYANRYNEIVCTLRPLTKDHDLPWSFLYSGNTQATCNH